MMMATTVHDTAASSQSSKPARITKLTMSSSSEIPSESANKPLGSHTALTRIKTKTIAIPSKPTEQSNQSNHQQNQQQLSSSSSNLTNSNSLSFKHKHTKIRSDYYSHKNYFSQAGKTATHLAAATTTTTSDSDDPSSKLEIKSASLEDTIVPILIVSSRNKLKTKYSDHFDQKTRAKFNNAPRIKKKQTNLTASVSDSSNTTIDTIVATSTNTSINNNNNANNANSNKNKSNDFQIHIDQVQLKNKINHYTNQPSSSLIPVESSAKQLDQAQQQQQQQQQYQQPTSSKLSTYSEMDVSTPYADVKQISVQNKPLGGKKIQLQTTNAFSATKFGIEKIEAKQITNPTTAVTKYTSISNGSLANAASTNQLTASNLMRSFLTSSNNPKTSHGPTVNNGNNFISNNNQQTSRGYFNHLNSSNNNSSNNIFNNENINDISTFSFVPSESVKNGNTNNINNSLNSNSSHFYGNNSLITASISNQQNAHSRHLNNTLNNTVVNNLHVKEKTNAQLNHTNNNSSNDKASLRDSSKIYDKNNVSNLRKENSIYVSTKENTSYNVANHHNNNNHHHSTTNHIKTKSNQAILDTNSITNSIYANSSNISIMSNSNHHQSNPNNSISNNNLTKASNSHRNVLSSKQINQQTPVITQNSTPNKNDCLTSSEALQLYGDRLTDFEKQEINEYSEIWFLGLEAEKMHATNVKDYDDENGAYIKVNKDHIAYRYEILETLGKGSFGQVIKCFDHKKKEHVAVKIIRSKKRFQQQGMVEVNILQHLKNLDHDNLINVVHMKEYFYFRNHLCITFEILGINLYELIKKNNYQGFSIHLVRRFAYSILQCMRVMFKENIIHCDMKPENILLRQKGSSAIKVIDFGSGCFQSQRIYTYIQSRFYRAPEIILGIPYTSSIDMWSFGCILVELFTGYPIFPGENEAEQLAMIMEVIDLPPANVLAEASRRKLFFDSKNMPRNLNTKLFKKRRVGSRSLAQILKTTDTNFIDFVSRCLEWDPALRMNAEEAMKHTWILELKKKSSKEIRPKHRLRREAETSIEQDTTHMGSNYNDNTYNEYHFQKQMNLHNTIDIKDHDLDGKKSVSNTFFPPLH